MDVAMFSSGEGGEVIVGVDGTVGAVKSGDVLYGMCLTVHIIDQGQVYN